ncbi:hypothetical protein F4604DRAFT_1682461 [Suillus subluteus]|nr:hypothetical protein F4604DRAFT_1682461 [Suillus subluteus]
MHNNLIPIFTFKGYKPCLDKAEKNGDRALDLLWGGGVSFGDKQMDLPFHKDRFVARAKMHEIQILRLLKHDVLSGIEIPYLPELSFQKMTAPTQADADQVNTDVLSCLPVVESLINDRTKARKLLKSGFRCLLTNCLNSDFKAWIPWLGHNNKASTVSARASTTTAHWVAMACIEAPVLYHMPGTRERALADAWVMEKAYQLKEEWTIECDMCAGAGKYPWNL